MGATRSCFSAPLIKQYRQQEHWRDTRTPLKGIATCWWGETLYLSSVCTRSFDSSTRSPQVSAKRRRAHVTVVVVVALFASDAFTLGTHQRLYCGWVRD